VLTAHPAVDVGPIEPKESAQLLGHCGAIAARSVRRWSASSWQLCSSWWQKSSSPDNSSSATQAESTSPSPPHAQQSGVTLQPVAGASDACRDLDDDVE
jgi:hypothetical protein